MFHGLTEAGSLWRVKRISRLAASRLRKPRTLSRPGTATSFPQQCPHVLADDSRESSHRAEGDVLMAGFDKRDILLRQAGPFATRVWVRPALSRASRRFLPKRVSRSSAAVWVGKALCCTDQQPCESSSPIHFHVRRTYSGRPISSMRFSDATAMATSVVCRPWVRERSASPITRL